MTSKGKAFQWDATDLTWGTPVKSPVVLSTKAVTAKPTSLYDHAVVGECSDFTDLIMGVVRGELRLFWDAVLWPALKDLKSDVGLVRQHVTADIATRPTTSGLGDPAAFEEPVSSHIELPPQTSVPTPPMACSLPASRPASAGQESSEVSGARGCGGSCEALECIPALGLSRCNTAQACTVNTALASPTVPAVVGQRRISDSWPSKSFAPRPPSPLMVRSPPPPSSSHSRRRVAPDIVKSDLVFDDDKEIEKCSKHLFGVANMEIEDFVSNMEIEDLEPSDSSSIEPGAPSPHTGLTGLRVSAPRDPPPVLVLGVEDKAFLGSSEAKCSTNGRTLQLKSGSHTSEDSAEDSKDKKKRVVLPALLDGPGPIALDEDPESDDSADSEVMTIASGPTVIPTPRKRHVEQQFTLMSQPNSDDGTSMLEMHRRLSRIGLSSGIARKSQDDSPGPMLRMFRGKMSLREFVESSVFDNTSALLMFANAITIGAQTDYMARNSTDVVPTPWQVADLILAGCFTLELILRLRAYGCKEFFTGPDMKWNFFDFSIVSLQIVEEFMRLLVDIVAGLGADFSDLRVMRVMRVLRLMRVVRVARVLRLINELRCIVASVVGSLRSLGWTVMLLTLLMFVVGVFFTQTVTDYVMQVGPESADPILKDAFGGLWFTILLLYQVVSGGIDWKTLTDVLLDSIGLHAVVLFVAYLAFVVLCMLNVVTGVFVDSALKNAMQEDIRMLSRNLKCIFDAADMDGDARLNMMELRLLLTHEETQDYLHSISIDPEDMCDLFFLMDIEKEGSVNAQAYLENCLKLRGPPSAVDMLTVLWEIRRVERCVFKLSKSRVRSNE